MVMMRNLRTGIAAVVVLALASVNCKLGAVPPRDAPGNVEEPCLSMIFRLSGAATFSFGNESSSAVLFISGCAQQLRSMTEPEKRQVYRGLQRWVQASPASFPVCNEQPRTSSWAARVNETLGRNVAQDACVQVTSAAW